MAVFMTLMLPVAVVFTRWAFAVWRDPQAANFRHTMHMNTIAALSTGIAFIMLTFIRQIE
jgi:1,4-dihydroxy-2-naphthoate octaprenyltransferase